jgi:UDP-N-acetylmuramoyl-tripeptide--D-alanyl-D-alanine ligase
MIHLSLRDIACILDCAAPAENPVLQGVATDSRKAGPGMLFAALPGSRVDGHDFASAAVLNGAAALLVMRKLDLPVPQLLVTDVLASLGRLAASWRKRLAPTVVGITGSNGKTTVKEMVAGVLGQQSALLATQGNYNNELGLPLTLFGLSEAHRYAVVEMGASKPGDIRYLADIAMPDIAVITNVGPAHLQGFGNEEGVARAKGEIFESLPADGCAIINSDEKWKALWCDMNSAGRQMFFGSDSEADVRFESDGAKTEVFTPSGSFELQLNLPGRHNLLNAMSAVCAGLALDLSLDVIRTGLESVQPVPGRLSLIHTAAGWTVIDDTYNANPASLYAALQVLMRDRGESWLVLGDMKELGTSERKLHAEMGEAARTLGIQRLFGVGPMCAATVSAFGTGGKHYKTREDLVEALHEHLHPGVTCLVKGSRSMGMEHVVQAISNPRQLREAG